MVSQLFHSTHREKGPGLVAVHIDLMSCQQLNNQPAIRDTTFGTVHPPRQDQILARRAAGKSFLPSLLHPHSMRFSSKNIMRDQGICSTTTTTP